MYAQHPDWFWPTTTATAATACAAQAAAGTPIALRCWFDTFLPDFNFQNDDARRWSVENAVSWAKRIGIDGFRLDAVKHIETVVAHRSARAHRSPRSRGTSTFYMVGETFDGNRDLIKSYVNPDTMLDGQFDFPLRGQVLATLLRRDGSMSDLVGFLDSNDGFYGAGSVMSTFLGNHDVPRAIEHALDDRRCSIRGTAASRTRGPASRRCRRRASAVRAARRSRTRCCSRCPGSR